MDRRISRIFARDTPILIWAYWPYKSLTLLFLILNLMLTLTLTQSITLMPLWQLFFMYKNTDRRGTSHFHARNPIRFMQEYERLRRRWENTSLLKKWRKTMYKQTNKHMFFCFWRFVHFNVVIVYFCASFLLKKVVKQRQYYSYKIPVVLPP